MLMQPHTRSIPAGASAKPVHRYLQRVVRVASPCELVKRPARSRRPIPWANAQEREVTGHTLTQGASQLCCDCVEALESAQPARGKRQGTWNERA